MYRISQGLAEISAALSSICLEKNPLSSASNLAESWNAGNMVLFLMNYNCKHCASKSITLELFSVCAKQRCPSSSCLYLLVGFGPYLFGVGWACRAAVSPRRSHRVSCGATWLLVQGRGALLLCSCCRYLCGDLTCWMSWLLLELSPRSWQRTLGDVWYLSSWCLDSAAGLGAQGRSVMLLYYSA